MQSYLGEILSFALMAGGLAGIIAFVGYQALLDQSGAFEQARYLLPLLPLYGLLVALAVRGTGRRAPVLSVVFVIAVAGLGIFAQLLTLSRFYG